MMGKPANSERFSIDGPAGRLEALLEQPGDSGPRAVAVICHPHPLHGGTMQNKVAHTLSRAFLASHAAAIRFNFRGVGDSEGTFNDGAGEQEDVHAVIDVARCRYPGIPVWLAGFSFGAAMSIRAATDSDVAGLVSIAPAAFRMADMGTPQPACPWLLIHGDNDELADIDETILWVNSMTVGPRFLVFPDTTHFFHGKLIDLRESVVAFVDEHSS